MADKTWGHCRRCKYFASPAKSPLGGEEARCEQPQLAKLELTVYGACGCNAWELRPTLEAPEQQAPSPS